jgi:diguanylate cyclase (GGDEF)-like protein/PAS domain S-box-containing protein
MFSSSKKIVVVDDSILNLKIIEKFLGQSYIEIISCIESTKAIELIKKEMPDLVLLDIHMPHLSGFDILKEMRADPQLSLIPVIFITASEDRFYLKQAFDLGSIDYLHKPILKEELISKVHNYLFHLEEKNILLRYFHIIDEYVYTLITDTENIILYVSNALLKKMDYLKQDILGSEFYEIIFAQNNEKIWEDIQLSLKQNQHWKGKIKIKTKDEFFWGDIRIECIYDNKKTLIGYQYIIHDITDKLVLQELAIRDPLTKIYNRSKLAELINYEIEKAQRYNKIFSLMMIDIDDFKLINDTFGHNTGDIVLKDFAKILTESIRKIDIVGRWGGEEFLILLPETKKEKAYVVAKRVKDNLSNKIVQSDSIKIPMNTASYGIAEYNHNDTLIFLIEKVDQSLYRAKKQGKNTIMMYE